MRSSSRGITHLRLCHRFHFYNLVRYSVCACVCCVDLRASDAQLVELATQKQSLQDVVHSLRESETEMRGRLASVGQDSEGTIDHEMCS